jgi:tetratricopeptide (TPR) repeat protein
MEIGSRLGASIDSEEADRLSACSDSERYLELINSSTRELLDKYPQETVDSIINAILVSDFAERRHERPRMEELSHNVYERLNAGIDDSFDEFAIRFRRFARRFRVTLDAIISAEGLKKEDISLDSPAIKDYLIELKELPGRRLGELSFTHRGYGCASLSRQLRSLLDRHMDRTIARDDCKAILDIMNKVAGHPGYFRSMAAGQRLIEARPLFAAISGLRLCPGREPEKADLLAALSILLFNVYPSQKLLRLLSIFKPSPQNDELLYDYYAIIALNYMLSGRLDLASEYNERAMSYARDEEKRTYALILESCIHLSRKDFDRAVAALSRCSSMAGDRRMQATARFYLGIVYYEMGRHGEAMECFRRSREGLDDELDLMSVGNNIGACAMLQGDLESAIREFEGVEHAGRYMTGNTAKSLMSVAYGCLGIIYLNMMEHDRAIGYLKKALRLDRDTHDSRGVANHLANIGLAHEARREYNLALEYFKSALSVSFMCDYVEGTLFSFSRIERLMALLGRFEEAEAIRQEMARRNPGLSYILSG